MTIEEAKQQGYKYAMIIDGEGELIPLNECTGKETYLLVSKDGVPFTVSNNLVSDLVDNYLCNQDIVSDDNGHLNYLAATVDYSDITKKLNDVFASTKYYFATDIKITK